LSENKLSICLLADSAGNNLFILSWVMVMIKYCSVMVIVVMLLKSCVDHDISDPDYVNATDESLFDEANSQGYTYYQSGNTIAPAAQSPHGIFRLRFNSTAFQALDATGELPAAASFPMGSVIVKEVYANPNRTILAVMKRAPADVNAGDGWLWAEYALDGTAVVGIDSKGGSCVSCHNDSPNRDLVRTFDLH
jgi:cytochrome c553